MSKSKADIIDYIFEELSGITGRDKGEFKIEDRLFGSDGVVRSAQLVELLLAMEEYAENDLKAEFNWQSDRSLSESRSIFLTVDTLAEHLESLQPK